MGFTLHCGYYHPELETAFLDALLRAVEGRVEPLRDQVLVVTPGAALRKRLLDVVASRCSGPLYGVPFVSLRPLCMQMAALSSQPGSRFISDPLYQAFLIQNLAEEKDALRPPNLRICRAISQTFRDLQDGGVSPDLLYEVLEAASSDSELESRIHPASLGALASLYRRYDDFCTQRRLLNPASATNIASGAATEFVRSRRITSVLIYGFYDSTETQFAVLENLVRAVAGEGGHPQFFFPFSVEKNLRVHHPDEYAQTFLDRLLFLNASLGGNLVRLPRKTHGASGGLEAALFVDGVLRESESPGKRQQLDLFSEPPQAAAQERPPHDIEVFSAAGEYDEAWAIAKTILKLVLEQRVSFDQILVILRSSSQDLTPLQHVFRENQIPSNLSAGGTLAHNPYAKFATLVLEARETALSPRLLMELLSSPFLPRTQGVDFHKLSDLMENLLIRSWDDWDRLEPLLSDNKLPDFYSFLEDAPPLSLQILRSMVQRIQELKTDLSRIPERGSLPEFAAALNSALPALQPGGREAAPLQELLNRISQYSELQNPGMTLPGFIDVFRMYLQETPWEPEEARSNAAKDLPGVTVADIMQARGAPADYVFVMGLNRDLFPRRAQEDPFLPDPARRALRDVTGAGPAEKKSRGLLPLKEGTDEELLLFGVAMRAARKKLFLSFRRADENGRKSAISNYLDEVLRLITGATSENNDFIQVVPRHHASKFHSGILPTVTECEALTALCPPKDVLNSRGLPLQYSVNLSDFAAKLNGTDLHNSAAVDGNIQDAAELWKQPYPEAITVSYSRLKSYLQCPFQFFARHVLLLEESPRDAVEEGHDLDARLKGRMAEDVVKHALECLKQEKISVEQAVDRGAVKVRRRYAALLPPVLLDIYMKLFRAGALQVLQHLEHNGYDLAASETPQYEDMMLMELLPEADGLPALRLRGIPDLLLKGRKGGLIGELKWGSRPVGRSTGLVFLANEAQFCTYPELVRSNGGAELPFRYFRMDVFASYGDPDAILRRIKSIPAETRIDRGLAVRIFGNAMSCEESATFLERVKLQADRLRHGDFRIVKEPTLQFGPCRLCSHTQICRRSHTETLLRAKRAEKE